MAALTVPVRPTLAGKALVGKKLKVKVIPATLPDGVTFRIQWFKGKKPIVGATGKKLKITEKYLGKKIRARLVYTRPGYAPVVLKTAKVKIK